MIRAHYGFLQGQGPLVVLGGRPIFARLRRKIAQVTQQFDHALLVAAFLGQLHRDVARLECLRDLIGGLGGFETLIGPQEVGRLSQDHRRSRQHEGAGEHRQAEERRVSARGQREHLEDARLKHFVLRRNATRG
jgi:hypothetical protein